MPALQVSNITTIPINITDPTGATTFSLTVASGATQQVAVTDALLGTLQPRLEQLRIAGQIQRSAMLLQL